MWTVDGNIITMARGDYGIKLPITITGFTAGAGDSFKLAFEDKTGSEQILTKEYSNISNNTIQFELTSSESALFSVGTYMYSLDWYQSGVFMCNIIKMGTFRVLEKVANQ